MTQNTKQEGWIEGFEKVWTEYPKNQHQNADGLDKVIKDFIRTIRDEAAEEAYKKGFIDGSLEKLSEIKK